MRSMKNDNTNHLLSLLSVSFIIILCLTYCSTSPTAVYPRIYQLLIDCIPDAIVALATVPILYWLLHKRGIVYKEDDVSTHASSKQDRFLDSIPEETIEKIASLV